MLNMTELHNLPAVEKLKIIESLWADLTGDEAEMPNLAWHETELSQTEKNYQAGNVQAIDWQQAKKQLRAEFE
ncbi:MAG: addiction module protein [Candidatus Methylumidiphilus sp.]